MANGFPPIGAPSPPSRSKNNMTDAIQKFIDETDRNYKGDADGERLAKAITMLEVMREAMNRIGMCVDPPDDYVWEATPTYEAQIAKEALQKCEQIAGGE